MLRIYFDAPISGAQFEVDDAIVDAVPTLRAAKRLINSLVAVVPADLTAECKRLLAL